jgi:phosphomevalonate kinase
MFNQSAFKNLTQVDIPTKKRMLGFCGRRKSGKTLAADIVLGLDSRFSRKSFADTLRRLFSEMTGVPVEDLQHTTKKERYRKDVIEFSKDVKKDKGLFYFAEDFFNTFYGDDLIVCDDLRILEELYLSVLFGSVVYRIHADNKIRATRGWVFDPEIDNDISETELGDLSSGTLYYCTGGGVLYNTKDSTYLEEGIVKVLQQHFPTQATNTEYPDLQKLLQMDI